MPDETIATVHDDDHPDDGLPPAPTPFTAWCTRHSDDPLVDGFEPYYRLRAQLNYATTPSGFAERWLHVENLVPLPPVVTDQHGRGWRIRTAGGAVLGTDHIGPAAFPWTHDDASRAAPRSDSIRPGRFAYLLPDALDWQYADEPRADHQLPDCTEIVLATLPGQALPCGCVLTSRPAHLSPSGQNELQIAPCSTSCVNYHNAVDLALDHRVPIKKRHA